VSHCEDATPERENGRIVETTMEARVGASGHHVRTVLVARAVGRAMPFAAVYPRFFC